MMHPSSAAIVSTPAPVAVEEFDAPNALTMDERRVWMELAPLAFARRTLTPDMMPAFVTMCRTVLLERAIAAGRDAGTGLHKGWVQEVRKQMDTFGIWPTGKPVYDAVPAAVKPANPLDRFMKRA